MPLTYLACAEPLEGSGRPCNRRVDESGFCASCKRVGKAGPRLYARCRFIDFADQAWLTSFDEEEQHVVGMTAGEVHKLERDAASQGDVSRGQLEAAARKQYFARPVELTMRATKFVGREGQVRSDAAVIGARPVQRGEHGRRMLKEVYDMLGEGSAIPGVAAAAAGQRDDTAST